MHQIEQDLGTRLEWVAVDHFNTGHPHTHIVLRGIDDRDQNLVIAREYISRGITMRAAELVNLDLGPRTTREIIAAGQREIAQERFTAIDRRLMRSLDENGLASPWHAHPTEQSLRAGRLGTLARMGLAAEEAKGRYRLDPALEDTLRAMGRRGDIIATMDERLRARPDIVPHDYVIHDPARAAPLVGRVLVRGQTGEHHDRRYLILEATDGHTHYVDLGSAAQLDHGRDNAMVRVSATPVQLRDADRIIAEVAAANQGTYSIDRHLKYDPSATQRFAEAHVRRLEAIRRGSDAVEWSPDGSWKIAPDHLDRVLAWERDRAAKRPVEVDILSDRPLEQMVRHNGVTWLDEQCVAAKPERLQGSFGARVREALNQRRQWLIEQGLAWGEDGAARYKPNMLASLRQRELRQVAGQLSQDLGLDYAEHRGGRIEGTYRKAVQVGTGKYALIEKSREFTLVPWRPVLERQIGRQVSGIERAGTISWRFGRGRSGPEIG
ncbi:conjugal transfer protein TraI [Novosphingobium endophyticum]|uniref:Conjugal transfer protein TraI n=1 Tax=Novosphingobium endophyticum TaxID=1955250 RepID=A0A916TW52_9SPHN|nr:DUF3363 domain-containing protein [Novosphingobium endophyticum]GGC16241.1 conjugal transfer protein TraI [Novosphingobium endophyticum]